MDDFLKFVLQQVHTSIKNGHADSLRQTWDWTEETNYPNSVIIKTVINKAVPKLAELLGESVSEDTDFPTFMRLLPEYKTYSPNRIEYQIGKAIVDNDREKINTLLEDANHVAVLSAIKWLVKANDTELLRMALKSIKTSYLSWTIRCAVEDGNLVLLESLDDLIDKATNEEGHMVSSSALNLAIKRNNWDILNYLLGKGVSKSALQDGLGTALEERNYAMADILLERGIKKWRLTSLLADALQRDDYTAASYLIRAGAQLISVRWELRRKLEENV